MIPEPDEQPPSVDAADPVVWSVPAEVVAKGKRPPARAWVHVVGALLLCTAPGLMVVGFFQGNQSMDVPWGDPIRYGLLGNGLPTVWRCSEGHEHVSAPFWLASLVLLSAALAIWRLLARRFTRPRPPGGS